MLAWWLLQAAVAGPMVEQRRDPPPVCPAATSGGDVVVCGHAPDQRAFRLHALPERYATDPAALPKAETSIFGGRARLSAETEQGGVGGFVSNRGMIRLKIPLGK